MDAKQEAIFTEFLRSAAQRAKAEIGYPPNQFLRSLNTDGGFATASSLLSPSKPLSDGFVTLWENKRLDLSVEALVLEHEWRPFFPEELLEVARKRLRDSGYDFREYLGRQLPSASPSPPQPRGGSHPIVDEEETSDRAWRITGPVENFLTAVQRGYWALNSAHEASWKRLQEGDVVFFHSTGKSRFLSHPPSAIIGFARVGPHKVQKDGLWWLDEIDQRENIWPYAFSITDACFALADASGLDIVRPLELKSASQVQSEILLVLDQAVPLRDIEAAVGALDPSAPRFPVNGSISRIRPAYRRAILSLHDWTPIADSTDASRLEMDLLSEHDRAAIDDEDLSATREAAAAFRDPAGPTHKQQLGRVRIESAAQKMRIAKLEDYTCQVCAYRQEYRGKSGLRRWIIHVDHIQDKADGHGERMENLWVLCPRCHAEKTCGVLCIDAASYQVVRLGAAVPIRNNHLPMP